jgi:RNA ligase (TIGR02306 family)
MRKLATIRKINNIKPIENADKIETVVIDGWEIVVKKEEFNIGDIVIYIEIDSWVPYELAPFLSKGTTPKEYKGIIGERLRTIKLRGQISQGLVIPNHLIGYDLYDDVSNELNIIKYEKPIPSELYGKIRGYIPGFIHKTYQERCQNLTKEILDSYNNNELFEISEKIDGKSMTVYNNNHDLGVCSKNISFKLSDNRNTFIEVANQTNILSCITMLNMNIAIQGELFGEGIRKNKEGIKGHNFAIFNIWDIDNQKYLLPKERLNIYNILIEYGYTGTHVNIIDTCKLPFNNISELLIFAENKNSIGIEREGLVFKSMIRDFSFKVISNRYLLKKEN